MKYDCEQLIFDQGELMGKKGKYKQVEEQPMPKKKTMITEEQLMDKTHMDKTKFIPLLPDESIYPPFIYNQVNQAALEKIVTDLNYLLYVSFKQFWSTLLYNPALRCCLSSCISYLHRRQFNAYIYSKESESQFQTSQQNLQHLKRVKFEPFFELTEGLFQVVLLIYHRIVSFNQQNKELSGLYRIGQQINKKFILDLPRLFQICQLYGSNNSSIVKFIIKMYISITPEFYKTLSQEVLPILFKKIEDNLRMTKIQTDRQEYGINYNYKRLIGEKLSQGEEELRKKITLLLDYISFSNIINMIIDFFPEECLDFCFFNMQIPLLFQNIFLELEIAYKSWDYQKQEIKILSMMNYVLKKCVNYMVLFFKRCHMLLVLRSKNVSTIDSYVLSLQRIFKDFGRRMTISKKNPARSLLLYKIIQKQFDLQSMLHSIYQHEEMLQNNFEFNMDYLRQIIITFDNQFKDEYIHEEEPRQEEIEEETQAEPMNNEDISDKQSSKHQSQEQKVQQLTIKASKQQLDELQLLVPKRMRSEDYYTKLYADFNKKFYKGQYDDDYDEIADFDKRPLATYMESSSSQEDQDQSHLVTNSQYLDHIKELHQQRFTVNRQEVRKKNVNQPTFGRVENDKQKYSKKYTQKTEKGPEENKKKYIAKNSEAVREGNGREQPEDKPAIDEKERLQYREREQDPPEEKRGGQGYKKSNKSYNYKPKDRHENNDKGRNTNKNKDYREKKYN